MYVSSCALCCALATHGASCLLRILTLIFFVILLSSLFLYLPFFSAPRLAHTLVDCFLYLVLVFLSLQSQSLRHKGDLFLISLHISFLHFSHPPLPFSHIQNRGPFPPISIFPSPLFPLPPPPLCVIHNGPSAGLHVSHMGGTPVFFNTFLIPPFDAPLVHHNLY